jgi:hypothetical protein
MGSVAKSYMRKGFLICREMRQYLTIYEEAASHIWLCNRSLLNFLKQYIRKILFSFLSVHLLTLWEHKVDPATYSRSRRGQCWFTPLPYEDTVMFTLRAQWRFSHLPSKRTIMIHSLTLWDHNIAYPLRVTLNIHSLTLHTKRAQWWIPHLAPQKWFTPLPYVDTMMIHSLTLWMQRMMHSPNPLTARIVSLTYLWITSSLSDGRCEGENSLTLWVHQGELDGPCVFQ